jgi:hypothetical protein
MREYCTSGSVRGAPGNRRPYRGGSDPLTTENPVGSNEHVTILKKGVEAWNRWRVADPQIWPDLSGVYLRDFHLLIESAQDCLRGRGFTRDQLKTETTARRISYSPLDKKLAKQEGIQWLSS